MGNKALAIFGIVAYILSVISSATDSAGNSVVPGVLILIAAVATAAFIIMASIRLWKTVRALVITFVVSSVVLSLASLGELFFSSYGSTAILFLNLVKIVAFISAVLVVLKLFKTNGVDPEVQEVMAEWLYRENPDLAVRIAIGEEQAPGNILPAFVYAKVCTEAEKSNDVDLMMRIANSNNNRKISADAKRLRPKGYVSAVEGMKEVVNARRKAFEKTLPKGKTYEMYIDEEVEKMKKEIAEAGTIDAEL